MCNLYIRLVSQLEPGKDNGEQKEDTLQTNTEMRHPFLPQNARVVGMSHQKCTWKEEQETILRHNVHSVEFTVVHNAQLLPVLLLTQSQLGNLQSRGKEGLPNFQGTCTQQRMSRGNCRMWRLERPRALHTTCVP